MRFDLRHPYTLLITCYEKRTKIMERKEVGCVVICAFGQNVATGSGMNTHTQTMQLVCQGRKHFIRNIITNEVFSALAH